MGDCSIYDSALLFYQSCRTVHYLGPVDLYENLRRLICSYVGQKRLLQNKLKIDL